MSSRLQNDGIVYATDTPKEKNFIYFIDCFNKINQICSISGTVINSMQDKNCWWFATAVEQDPDTPKIIHYFDTRPAKGIQDNYVHIYIMKKNEIKVEEICKLEKDLFPMWLFQFGNVTFVNNYKDNSIYIIPIAVKKYSQNMIIIIT